MDYVPVTAANLPIQAKHHAWATTVEEIMLLPLNTEAVRGQNIGDAELVALQRFPNLQELWIHGHCYDEQWGAFRCQVTDEGMKELVKLRSLRRLTMACGGRGDIVLSDLGLSFFKELPNLTALELGSSNPYEVVITNEGLAHIGDCARLKHLAFGPWAGITEEGFKSLANLKQLECLYVHQYIDQFASSWNEPLKALLNLKKMSIY